MKSFVDSQSFIWALDDPPNLSANAVVTLQNPANDLLISTATIWEIAIKVGSGKLKLSLPYRLWIENALITLDAVIVPVTLDHCEVQSTLPRLHGDPFDRMIAAQCLFEKIPVVSSDAVFDQYGVTRIW